MKVLVSEKLSEHKYKTPEGYLICTDAILARTGKQSYTKDELFQDGDDTEVNVDRPYDEVMNTKTIASFENKPITFDHPDEDVNVGNYKDYAIGYVRDVRQGKTDKGEDVILGNLVITDQDAINAIEQGDHTDLSCGYDCDIRDDGNGNYSQTNIRGNHLALCEQGRAGIAHIVDSKTEDFDMKDAGDYSWFKGYINGDLQSYDINSLINNVKRKQRSLHTNLGGKSGNVYTVFIDGSLKSNLDDGSDMWIDIIVEKPNGQQKRLISEKFNSWNECQKIFNNFKSRVRDSVEDSKVDNSKEMTMSDAIKMLYIVDAYKKVRDASTDKWVIKNTGLAYEVWNGGKLIKKFATKKQAIEWIHSRFPIDEITEDSTKDGKIWSTLTRKAKHS